MDTELGNFKDTQVANKPMKRRPTSLIIKDMQIKPNCGGTAHPRRQATSRAPEKTMCWPRCVEPEGLHCGWERERAQLLG